MRFLARLGVCTVTAATALLGSATVAFADDMPPVVEDNDYPGAARILAERGIKLLKGDGHMLLDNCVIGADVTEVRSRNHEPFCFRVTGGTGWITLEQKDAFLVFGDSKHTTVVKYTVDDVAQTKTIQPGGAEGIGEGSAPGKSAVLRELRVSS